MSEEEAGMRNEEKKNEDTGGRLTEYGGRTVAKKEMKKTKFGIYRLLCGYIRIVTRDKPQPSDPLLLDQSVQRV
jgi:hypothetical protein